jgi:hypothetical protein
MDLTTSEISDYLLRNAFSTSRTTSTTSTSTDKVSTDTLSDTMKLLSGSSTSLDKVQSNLKEMLTIAESITNSSTDAEKEAAYAKLRSLSSGMDDIVNQTTYDKNTLFDGTNLDLYGAGKYSSTVLDDLSTTDGLGLATSSDGADITVSYDSFCTWNNALYEVDGLDISAARSSKASISQDELTDGDYILEVDYMGANSTVKIQDKSGNVVSELDNVDLSGSGVETLTFDCGVQLDVDKTQTAGSTVDKYDYENKGAAVLYADINYKRINTYDLTGSQTATQRSVTTDFTSTAKTDSAGGTFSISSFGLGSLEDNENELADGTYTVQVYKIGDTVSGIMYDTDGNVVGSSTDVTLNTDGTTSLDFNNGTTVSVDDQSYSGNTSLNAVIEYKQAVNSYDDFDFDAYIDKINDAVSTVTEQQEVLKNAYTLTNTVYEAVNGTLDSSVYSTTSLLIKNLLGGDTDTTSAISLLSGTSSTNSGLDWADSLIMTNLTSALGVDSDSGTSLSSLLGGTTDTLDPTSLPATNNASTLT